MSLMSKFNAPVASNDDGRRLFSRPPSKAYSDGWDAVFGKRGCPCGENCCDSPKPAKLKHDCPHAATRDSESPDWCEDCFACHCTSCGKTCWCDL